MRRCTSGFNQLSLPLAYAIPLKWNIDESYHSTNAISSFYRAIIGHELPNRDAYYRVELNDMKNARNDKVVSGSCRNVEHGKHICSQLIGEVWLGELGHQWRERMRECGWHESEFDERIRGRYV